MSSDQSQFEATFLEEARENLPRFSQLLIELESTEENARREALIRDIFRLAHTLKGSASSVGRNDIARVAHEAEACLDQLRRGKLTPSKAVIDSLLGVLDVIEGGLEQGIPPEMADRACAALSAVGARGEPQGRAPASPAPAVRSAVPAASVAPEAPETQDALGTVADLLAQLGAAARGEGDALPRLLAAARRLSASAAANGPNFALVARDVEKACALLHRESPPALASAILLGADFLRSDLVLATSEEEARLVQATLNAAMEAQAALGDKARSGPPARLPGAPELENIFRKEARETLPRLAALLRELEGTKAGPQRDESARELCQLARSLKGAASSMGRRDVAGVAQDLEACLELVRKGKLEPTKGLVDGLRGTLDALTPSLEGVLSASEVDRLCRALQALMKPAIPEVAGPEQRVSSELLDEISQVLGKLGAVMRGEADAISLLNQAAQRLAGAAPADRHSFGSVARALQRACGGVEAGGPPDLAAAIALAVDFLRADLQSLASDEQAGIVIATLSRALESALLARQAAAAQASPPAPASPEASRAPAPAAPAAAVAPPAPRAAAESSVRVPVAMMDTLAYHVDEMVALKIRVDYQRRQIEETQSLVDTLAARLASVPDVLGDLELLKRRLEMVRRDLAQDVHLMGLASQALQDGVKDLRTVPVAPLLEPFRRMARDLAQSLGKEIAVELEGEQARVDKRLLEAMRDPIMHMFRNAIDHGIEPPAERQRKGKPARGNIRLKVETRDSSIWIRVEDDGRGIDPQRIREAAVDKGLLSRESAQALSDREALNLIFQSGFTTAKTVTAVSGRGVGLDVVRENVARLGGRIDFYSKPDEGTQMYLSMPLALSASTGLVVRAGRHLYCVPLSSVQEVGSLVPADIGIAHNRMVVTQRRQTVPFLPLEDLLLHQESRRPNGPCVAVILAVSDLRLALGVDEFLGNEELVIKRLVEGTPRLGYVSGVTSLPDGQLVSVLDPARLVKGALKSRGPFIARQAKEERPLVVVADDSLTSRAMLSSLLERRGYRTLLASDGESAFSLLQQGGAALLISDVEMPNTDGISLTKRVRATPGLTSLPIILVTSLSSSEEIARGGSAGANGYIPKQELDPSRFLEMVNDFIGLNGPR